MNPSKQTLFYKSPAPLLIGNLPFQNFISSLYEYEYLDYYVTTNGIVYYSKYFDNYVGLTGDVSWNNLYPNFNLNGNEYCLNPFVNDLNGICSWIPMNDEDASSIYWNTKNNRFECGLGEDAFNHDGVYLRLAGRTYSNAYTERNMLAIDSKLETYEELNSYNLDTKIDYDLKGYSLELINPSSQFETKTINETVNVVISSNSFNSNEDMFIKTNELEDLDVTNNLEKDSVCGYYENKNSNFILGSVVIGNADMKFIGVNKAYSRITDFNYNYTDDSNTDNAYKISDLTNVYPIKKSDEVIVDKFNQYSQYSLNNYDYFIHLGYRIFSNEPLNMYYVISLNTEGKIKNQRIFLAESLELKKYWYCDLNFSNKNSYSVPELFNYPMKYEDNTFTELTFNYVNEEDESDVKSPITFTIQGATRQNAHEKLFECPIEVVNLIKRKSEIRAKTSVYIGYWLTPVTNIGE